MYPNCLQMLWKQDLFQNYIFFDEMSSDHRRTWKKWLSSIYLMPLQLLSCILPQALPGINALKEFESSNSGMHSMKPICNRRGKKKSLLFNSSILHFSRSKSYSLFFSRHSPKGSPSERSRAKYSPFKGKNLWHFDVNLTVHCRSLFAFTARKVMWAAELRPTDVKDSNFTSSVNNSGQLEFL